MTGRSPLKYATVGFTSPALNYNHICITCMCGYLPYMRNGFALLEIPALVVVVLQNGHYKALYRLGKLEKREVAGK